ncbi:hypothetical protein QO259_10425 [Salinicola sp. JS01]|uniref:phage tail tube protein n=1 Tax=Salinicola sp. JS01 TaxID=3050071 RepID=UPI00255C00B7|nr:phage tail tube protein [Salinicola sp. JS01]WIX31250.1 hypothetical protein QO259_10425 [Salinicola sp. JS01]
MSSQKTNRRVMRFGIESSYNADTLPDVMAAIQPASIEVTPLSGDDIQRSVIRPYYGNTTSLPGEKHMQVQIAVEMVPPATAGTAPPWGDLLKVCGFAETLVPADGDTPAQVVYAPISDKEESGRLYCHVDKNLHEGRGARGTVQFALNAQSVPTMTITLMALLRPVADAQLPTVDLTAWQNPLAINSANTGLTVFGRDSTPFSQFSLDMGVQTRHRTVVDANDISINGRSPSGSMQIDDPGVAEVNFFQRALSLEPGAIVFEHGTVAGKTIELSMPRVTIQSPSYADDGGDQMLTIPYTPEPIAGDDEVRIVCR